MTKPRGGGRGHGAGKGGDTVRSANDNKPSIDAASDKPHDTKDEEDVSGALVDALRVFSTPQWWTIGQTEDSQKQKTIRKRTKLEEFSKTCAEKHAEMARVFEATMKQDSEQRWLRKVISTGTSGDKVASLVMLVQVCPVFCTGYLKTLLSMASKFNRSDSVMAIDALKDLFSGTLLPDRKLKSFAQMDPVSPKGMNKIIFTQLSVISFFEDYLKTAFAGFIHVLSEAAHSSVIFFKIKAIQTSADLLSSKPEQERALLGLLVNKFGDMQGKVTSKSTLLIKKLLQDHPGMKGVVTREMETFLARPNITDKSKYTSILLLTEMPLLRTDGELAARLVRLFVLRLEEALRPPERKREEPGERKKKALWKLKAARLRNRSGIAEESNRLVRTLINGVHRALPYMDTTITSSPLHEETIDTLFKVGYTVSAFSTRIAILNLLYRCLSEQAIPARFYRLVYWQVAQFELFQNKHRHQAYLFLQKCVPADLQVGRAIAVSRRLLQLGANAEPAVAAVALSVLRGVLMAHRAELRPLLNTTDSQVKFKAERANDGDEHFVDDDAVEEDAPQSSDAAGADGGRPTYTPGVRDPLWAKSRATPIWELFALRNHVHPFVAYGASKLLNAETYQDVTSTPFDTFCHTELLEQLVLSSRSNRIDKWRPKKGIDSKDAEKGEKGKQARTSFDDDKFSKKMVAPHEKFFQLYFGDATVSRKRREKARKQRKDQWTGMTGMEEMDEERFGPVEDEETDAFFDNYLSKRMPEVAGEAADEFDDDDEVFSPGGSDMESDENHMEDGSGEGEDEDFSGAEEGKRKRKGKAGKVGKTKKAAGKKGAKGKKRKAEAPPLSSEDRIKKLRETHTGASAGSFASAEDFEGLLEDDD